MHKLSQRQHVLLIEALRRFDCFAVRQDKRKWNLANLQIALTGLGSPSEYKAVTSKGLMMSHRDPETPRVMNWYRLTERGAKIVLAWYQAGFHCDGGWEVNRKPPITVDID
jgi:hypothetical protein